MPTGYFGQYVTIAAFAVIGVVLVFGTLALSSLVRPNVPTAEKITTYESGIDPVGLGWSQTHIRYYMFAFMFVVFDVETLFVFPWATFLTHAEDAVARFMLGVMLVFLFFVTITLPYEWKKGVLKWV